MGVGLRYRGEMSSRLAGEEATGPFFIQSPGPAGPLTTPYWRDGRRLS